MIVGIVGHAADKFTLETEAKAKKLIRAFLKEKTAVLCSGACHLGGIDIWAEEIADELGRKKIIHKPKTLTWFTGYKPRNLLIAQDSDLVNCIVVAQYPPNYEGTRFAICYHCHTDNHIKSGGCWTMKEAIKLGKPGFLHIL